MQDFKLALALERIFSRRSSGITSAVLGVSSLILVLVALTFFSQAFLGFFLIVFSLASVIFVYWSYLSYLQSDRHGQVSFVLAKTLHQSVRGGDLYLESFFDSLLRQKNSIGF